MFGLVPFESHRFESPFAGLFSDYAPVLRNGTAAPLSSQALQPRVDIHEDADSLILSAELPGIEKETTEIRKQIHAIEGELASKLELPTPIPEELLARIRQRLAWSSARARWLQAPAARSRS